MLARMPAGQIDEWRAYERIEPFGDEQLTRLFLYALAAMGGQPEWETLRRREPVETEEGAGPTLEETAAAIHAAFGT